MPYNEGLMAKMLSRESKVDDRPAQGALPVGVVAMPVKASRFQTKPDKLLQALAESGMLVMVDRKRRILGVVHERDVLLSEALPWVALREPETHMQPTLTLSQDDTVSGALVRFGETDQALLPIVDDRGRYTGQCASRHLLFKLLNGMLRPQRVGGLATPLGVYMTSGYYMAGAGWPGLVATGVMFALLMYLLDWGSLIAYSVLASVAPQVMGLAEGHQLLIQTGLIMVLLLSALRLTPLAGLHAAEHMTINAIELDAELNERVVRMQPREHVRCGTNLMVLLLSVQVVSISLLASFQAMSPVGILLYVAFWSWLIIKYWRRVGLWLQRHFTTKPPSDGQLASGLKAGRDLLAQFSRAPHPVPGFWRKLWGSGILHMLGAFLLTSWLLGLLLEQVASRL